jgi:hypothetical protein
VQQYLRRTIEKFENLNIRAIIGIPILRDHLAYGPAGGGVQHLSPETLPDAAAD